MKPLFLVNARSGASRRRDIAAVIRSAYADRESQFDIRPCERKEDLDEMVATAAGNGHDLIYAVGGDGTVHEIARRLIHTNLALGILPTGSGNGMARHLGIPLDPARSLAACRTGRVVTIDTAAVNGMPFIAVLGAGFDAVIAHRFALKAARGFRTYLREGVAAFTALKAEEYEIEIDGRRETRRASIVAVANASQYGNNARIAPLASLQDQLLDVVVIGEANIASALPLIVRLFSGTLHRSRHVTVTRASSVIINRGEAGPIHVDGEPLVMPGELRISVDPASLRVLVPSCSGHF